MKSLYLAGIVASLLLMGQGCQKITSSKPELLPKALGKSSQLKQAFDKQWAQSTNAKYGCIPDAMYVCSAEGCNAVEPSSYFIVEESEDRMEASKGKATYKRCDLKGCNEEDVRMYQSGIFTQVTDNGISLKIQTEGILDQDPNIGSFSDVVSLFNTRMASFGECKIR